MMCRKHIDDVKTMVESFLWDMFTACAASGIKAA
ncbi:hypothetical protein FORC11_p0183 (plasmid) [Shigella sonnei]|nr:hypothetical protein FORC11_p0183 [Shigella sonnei]